MENFEIRVMSRDEVNFAVEWAAKEGWNPGLHDADAFYAADREGFLIGLLNGEPVAAISVSTGATITPLCVPHPEKLKSYIQNILSSNPNTSGSAGTTVVVSFLHSACHPCDQLYPQHRWIPDYQPFPGT